MFDNTPMKNALLSICIPTYNRAYRLNDLLALLVYEIKPLNGSVEVVVCDNCSTDDTRQVASQYKEIRLVKYFRNSQNIGIASNIMHVPSLSTGKYCWIIGDDDLPKIGSISRIDVHIDHICIASKASRCSM